MENIQVAELLHDLGKIEVSGEILRKPADMTTEELTRKLFASLASMPDITAQDVREGVLKRIEQLIEVHVSPEQQDAATALAGDIQSYLRHALVDSSQ